MMDKYTIIENEVSDVSVRNRKEKYSLADGNIINIRCRHGQYDPEIQRILSAKLSIGKVEKVRRGREKIGLILRLKIKHITTLVKAISDSGFLEKKEKFFLEARSLDGFVPVEKDEKSDDVQPLLKDSPKDRAYQEFFANNDNEFWDLCLIYFDHMYKSEQEIYRFFISY